MSLNKKHVVGFSPDGYLFALVDNEGVLRIWNTETNELKNEFTPNWHQHGFCTVLVWVGIQDDASSKNSGKKENSQYIVLGNSKGQLCLFSYGLGKILRSFKGEGHNGKITGIDYDNAGKLYTCGVDSKVIQWSLAEQKLINAWDIGPEKPHSIVYLPVSKCLAIGCRQIRVYDLNSWKLVQKLTGHATEISLMHSLIVNEIAEEYVVTAPQMERIICLWKVKSGNNNKTADFTLLMEDVVHAFSCSTYETGLRIASVTRSGVVHIHYIEHNATGVKPTKPKVTFELASNNSVTISPIPALAVYLQRNEQQPHEVLLGYGNKHAIVFEQITPNFKEKINVLVRAEPNKLYKDATDKKTDGSAVALKTRTPVIHYNDVETKSTIKMSKKNLVSKVPMEFRLQNLNTVNSSEEVTLQAKSKAQLLVQSLHSRDPALLRSVLCTKDIKTVQLTLQRLPAHYVDALVNELTLLMQTRRVNVEYAIIWLKVLAETHSSQLLALGAEDLVNKFGPCLGIIEHRAHCLQKVSNLSGRLNLLISQLKRDTEKQDEEGLQLQSDQAIIVEDSDQVPFQLFGHPKVQENWSEIEEKDDFQENNQDEMMALSMM